LSECVRVGIIGDSDPDSPSHIATDAAIGHGADALGIAVDIDWLPTPALDGPDPTAILAPYDALWASPGSPYRSMDGALAAIRFAREHDRPFLGT
jgi:CTP synthase (UTP-ammonia lyase)